MAHWPLGIKSQLSVPLPAIPTPEHGHMARPGCGPPQWGRESHLERDQGNGLIEAWWYPVITGLRRYLPDEDPRVHVKGPQPSLMSLGGHGGWPCSAEDCPGLFVLAQAGWGPQEQPQAGRSSSITSSISHCSVGQGPSFSPHSHFTQEHPGPAQERKGQDPLARSPRWRAPFPITVDAGCELLTW